TGADFSKMPTVFSSGATDNGFYVWLNGASLNISRSGTATNPAYQLPLSKVTSLTFHLTTAGAKLVMDYSTGDIVPAGGVVVDGGGLATSELKVIGAGVPLNFTDTAVGEVDGAAITYAGLGGMTFSNSVVNFNG